MRVPEARAGSGCYKVVAEGTYNGALGGEGHPVVVLLTSHVLSVPVDGFGVG